MVAIEAAQIVKKEVDSGRWVGPYMRPPLPAFKQTPLALVEEPDKCRQITNAKMGACVNESIPDPEDAVHMPTHTELKRRLRVLAAGRGTQHLWMAKRDIKAELKRVFFNSSASDHLSEHMAGH